MRILTALTYYRPHYSGLTIYTERLARALAGRGHQVTVLTSRFSSDLLAEEDCSGVHVVRVPVFGRVSKGVLMPAMPFKAWKYLRQADIVHLHLPQLDAAYLALLARLVGKRVVVTYHCDLQLPTGLVHRIANLVSHLANHISALAAHRIVTNTRDYAENSSFLKGYLAKVCVVPPPVVLAPLDEDVRAAFRQKWGLLPGQRVIGMAARLATEKGVEYLIEAMPAVLAKYPDARVLFVGQYQDVLGEEAYAARLAPLIEALGGQHWTFLGVLPPAELTAFFHECDVTVLPSLNGTESFGMVQVEAMTCGTPVISSDLPGVREPVRLTGMGRVVTPRDSAGLAAAIIEILDHPDQFQGDMVALSRRFAPPTIAVEYEQIFEELIAHP